MNGAITIIIKSRLDSTKKQYDAQMTDFKNICETDTEYPWFERTAIEKLEQMADLRVRIEELEYVLQAIDNCEKFVPDVQFQQNVDGIQVKGKVNRLVYENDTYGYHFYIETPISPGSSEYFGYMALKEEFLGAIEDEDIPVDDLTFPFDEFEDKLPEDAWDCEGGMFGDFRT